MSPRVIVREQKLWPLRPRASLAATAVSLAALLTVAVFLKTIFHWPSEGAEAALLIGITVISMLPIILALADLLIEHGGAVEFGNIKLNFSGPRRTARAGVVVPAKLGARGEPLYDSDTAEILDALRSATGNRIAIVDLEGGEAWWETRLLVLLEGADRLGSPASIVFQANQRGRSLFQGWAPSSELFEHIVAADPQYARHVAAARAAGRQWSLVEPPQPGVSPTMPPHVQGLVSPKYGWMAFDSSTGQPNPLLTEQVLQAELGLAIEADEGGGRPIGLSRLESLFGPILRHQVIELTANPETQLASIFESQEFEIPIVERGEYLAMVGKASIAIELFHQLSSSDANPN
jgi:hypothetical protein